MLFLLIEENFIWRENMVELEFQNYEENVKLFNKTKEKLSKVLTRAQTIEHVGSTAIENMFGKNIIDILVGVKNQEDFDLTFKQIEALGFRVGKRTESNFYHFFASSESETKSGDIHIHLVIIGTERYEEFLILRDFLKTHPEEAKKYSDHKLEMIKNGVTERKEYRATKSLYVENLINRAKQELKNK